MSVVRGLMMGIVRDLVGRFRDLFVTIRGLVGRVCDEV